MSGSGRERGIERIVASNLGIYGAEVCQLCGRVGMFSGWASALGLHGLRYEFLCREHWRRRSELALTGRRWCESCCRPVDRRSATHQGRYYLCSDCTHTRIDPRRRFLLLQPEHVLRGWPT